MLHIRSTTRHSRWPLLLTLALLLLSTVPTALAAPWPAAEQVNTDTTIRANEPSIDYDRDGFAHVVWFGGADQEKWVIYYSNNRGGAWSPPRIISAGGNGEERSPSITVGNDDHIHVTYDRRNDSEAYYVEGTNFGANWGRPINISNSPSRAFSPLTAVDANGGVHAVWPDRRWNGKDQTTYAYRPPGGSFGAPRAIGVGQFESSPQIITTGSGANVRVHVVFQAKPQTTDANSKYELYYVRGIPNSFEEPRNLFDDDTWDLSPTIESKGNELYIAWDKQVGTTHHVQLSRSTDGGTQWTPPRDVFEDAEQAFVPNLAMGGGGQLHLAWYGSDKPRTLNNIYYLRYDTNTNTFATDVEVVDNLSVAADSSDVGAHPNSGNVGIVYQSQNRVYVSRRDGAIGPIPTPIPPTPTISAPFAQLQLNGGNLLTRDPNLSLSFSEVTGSPTELRMAFDRPLTDADPWEAFTATMTRQIPALDTSCKRTLSVQLRNAAGLVSTPIVSTIDYDVAVQASMTVRNPFYGTNNTDFTPLTAPAAAPQDLSSNGASDGDTSYTRRNIFYLDVAGSGECAGLRDISLSSFTTTYTATDNRFINVLPLPGGLQEGPREVAVRVRDKLDNEATVTQQIIYDRTAPVLGAGQLSVAVPAQGLPSVLTDLSFSGLTVTDNLYPGGFWGVWVANTQTPSLADDDLSLDWRPLRVVASGPTLVVPNWNVALGLDKPIGDQSLVGQDIQVRVRFIDGAGNPSATSLTTTVKLAPNYRTPARYLPLLSRSN